MVHIVSDNFVCEWPTLHIVSDNFVCEWPTLRIVSDNFVCGGHKNVNGAYSE
jgi:hypothetical protein